MASSKNCTDLVLKLFRDMIIAIYQEYEKISNKECEDKDTVAFVKEKFMELISAISDQRNTLRNWFKSGKD